AAGPGWDAGGQASSFLARQLQSGVVEPLDKSKVPNYKKLDPALMEKVAEHDAGDKYAVAYLWGTAGIGYNVDKVKAALGADAPVNSWDLVLKPENLEKLKSCGVSFLDAPEEIFATVLNYLGKDPNTSDAKEYSGAATDLLLKLRPNIRYFHSSQYINDLANGNICVAIGWSGDILQAKNRADAAKNGVHLGYSVPKEGALAFFDMMAIPKDAKNLDGAYAWLNYIMDPKVIADVSNKMNYANGNKASLPLINADVRNNPGIFPTPEAMSKLFVLKVQDPKLDRVRTRAWTKVKSGK
ncbi:MAG TPA: spermidine/putrescine ABC transporter substrate-binding protein PotF, partial [Pantoea agglomerans]|nr:spermidine/putrescine ABC transporter substrate-binding protein PotF [Pantoea agglomerans]